MDTGAVEIVVKCAADVLAVPGFSADDRLTLIAGRWRQHGVGANRDPAVWAAKRAVLAHLIESARLARLDRQRGY